MATEEPQRAGRFTIKNGKLQQLDCLFWLVVSKSFDKQIKMQKKSN